MKSMVKIIVPGLALVILMSCAGTGKKSVNSVFENIDVNKDDKITLEEFSEDIKDRAFDKINVDKDREVTEAEWLRIDNIAEGTKHAELFKEIDKNKDRRITFFEFSDYADRHSNIEEAFMVRDKDRDNSLSVDEISVLPIFRMITIRFELAR